MYELVLTTFLQSLKEEPSRNWIRILSGLDSCFISTTVLPFTYAFMYAEPGVVKPIRSILLD